MIVLQVDKVNKYYGDFRAVNDVSFSVESGKIFGLIGPNGAGKSSTMRMLMNITVPDSGEIRLFSEKWDDSMKDRIGYLPEERGLYPKMKVLDQLQFLGEMKGMSGRDAKQSAVKWLERLELTEWSGKATNELSKGMAQKIQFIGTIIHDPELIIMDEPFSGLDPVNARFLKDTLLNLKDEGKAIILSTHLMENAEKLCEDICMINKGKVVLSGKLAAIRKEYSHNSVLLSYEGDGSVIRGFECVEQVNDFGNYMQIRLKDGCEKHTLFRELADSELRVSKFEATDTSLEDIFINIVGRKA
ncbi:MAG: ABC transporter ATP-binding protein [Candidatus Muiribacteriaceae bacterium]